MLLPPATFNGIYFSQEGNRKSSRMRWLWAKQFAYTWQGAPLEKTFQMIPKRFRVGYDFQVANELLQELCQV